MPLGLGQQRHPPRQAHGHAERILVGGRGVDEPRRRVFPLWVEPLFIHRHRVHPGAGTLHGGAGPGVAGILHPDGIAGIDQQLGRQQDPLLGAGEDQDLVRLAHHAARLHQIAADGAAQRLQPLRLPVIHPVAGVPAPLLLHQPAPQGLREEAGIRLAGGKGAAHLGHVVTGTAVGHLLASARQTGCRLGRARSRGDRGQCHEAAGPHLAHQIALRLQPAIGQLHRAAGDPQIGGQHAAGGQPAVLGQVAGQHGRAQGADQLFVQRQIAGLLGGKQGGQGRHGDLPGANWSAHIGKIGRRGKAIMSLH